MVYSLSGCGLLMVAHEYKCVLQVGERIFTLDQAELAFRSLAAGGHKGKLVIRMTTEDVRSPAPEQQLALRR